MNKVKIVSVTSALLLLQKYKTMSNFHKPVSTFSNWLTKKNILENILHC